MTNTLKGIYKFWRNFIFGDEPYVAIAVVWALIALYSFFLRGIRAWYILPILVAILLALSFRKAFIEQGLTNKLAEVMNNAKVSLRLSHTLCGLILAIPIVPFCIFFINDGLYNLSFGSIVAPELVFLAIGVILGFGIAYVFKKSSTLAHIVAAIATLISVHVLYNHEVNLIAGFNFSNVSVFSHTTMYGWLGLVICLFVILLVSLVKFGD
jgi:hypothetical protein